MCISITLSQSGLLLDALGVAILAYYNTPKDLINKYGLHYSTVNLGAEHEDTIKEVKRYKTHRFMTVFGYTLLFLGFLLQFPS